MRTVPIFWLGGALLGSGVFAAGCGDERVVATPSPVAGSAGQASGGGGGEAGTVALGGGGESVSGARSTSGASSGGDAPMGSATSGGEGGGAAGDGTTPAAGAGGQAAEPCTDPLGLPLLREAPATLAETGLYESPDAHDEDLAGYVRSFRPRFELWSDGAEKRRFVYLPDCAQVDTADMDNWKFPVGARFWKEFTRDGTLIETRFIHRYGAGNDDWLFTTYQWDPADRRAGQARRVEDGVKNANGTPHDIPSRNDCRACHLNLPEPPLAFSALQLSHALGGVTLRDLSETGRLTHPATQDYVPPGDDTARAALGYLHANCGHCHNSSERSLGNALPGDPPPRLRLSVHDREVEQTTTYTTLLSVATFNPTYGGYSRIEPCDPQSSSAFLRMATRAFDGDPMPPLASELVHDAGVNAVSSFIRALPAPGAAPCP